MSSRGHFEQQVGPFKKAQAALPKCRSHMLHPQQPALPQIQSEAEKFTAKRLFPASESMAQFAENAVTEFGNLPPSKKSKLTEEVSAERTVLSEMQLNATLLRREMVQQTRSEVDLRLSYSTKPYSRETLQRISSSARRIGGEDNDSEDEGEECSQKSEASSYGPVSPMTGGVDPSQWNMAMRLSEITSAMSSKPKVPNDGAAAAAGGSDDSGGGGSD